MVYRRTTFLEGVRTWCFVFNKILLLRWVPASHFHFGETLLMESQPCNPFLDSFADLGH